MSTLIQFDEVREEIKGFLPQYLSKFGIDARDRKRFSCLSPTHADRHPSCSVIPGSTVFHCFSCGFTGDIFDAAAAKENKPLSGRGFVTDNLMYLAKTFGVNMPELNLSDAELLLIETRRAYAQAARIITQRPEERSELIANKLKTYMWSEDVIQQIGIGSVKSFADYWKRMTEDHGHSAEFLKSIDLDRKGIFSPNCLIYTVRDEHGSPIAFSARNLMYESEKVVYEKKYDEIEARTDLNKDEKTALIKELWEPRKCVNNAETTLFQKRCVLFNFNQAKKSSHKTIQVFEGNADAVTIFAGGIKTAVATCGTAFTQEHLEMVIAAGITKIVLVFDPDKGGKEGTARFVKMLEEFGSHPGLEVEIIVMPGTSDPDAYVRAFGDLRVGVSEFRKLVRTDLFTWKLRKEVEEGADPYEICNRTLPLIVNVPNNMTRLAMADRLAEATGLNREFVQRELLRLLDTNEMKVEEELAAIAQQTIKALQQNPKAMDAILATAATRRDAILESKVGYDARANLKSFETTIEKMEAATDMFELVTGYPIFDSLMGGVPKEGALFTWPGKPFHGKSILIDNFIVNMLRLNPSLQIMLHHVDDAALLRVPRILGIMSKMSSRTISKAGTSRTGTFGEEFEERYGKALAELRGWITDERLIMADQSRLVGSLPAHERWIKEIRRRNSHGSFISVGDNFHLFDMPGMEPGEGKVREMSKFIAGLPTKHGITTMFTMELPKDILKPGTRPKYTDSKNSGGIAFDSKVNLNVYQELQDMGDDSVLTWRSPEQMIEVVDPSGATVAIEKPLPIIEAIVDKNKVTGLVKTIYYRLEPLSGVVEECSPLEQISLQSTLDAAKKDRKASVKSYAENRRQF
jgi:DNA primase